VFLLTKRDTRLTGFKVDKDSPQLKRDWAVKTPERIKRRAAVEQLNLDEELVLDYISFNRSILLNEDSSEDVAYVAQETGRGYGDSAGTKAETMLPMLRAEASRAKTLSEFANRYDALGNMTDAQQRGIDFEKLWRDVLEFHGWHPKKIRIPGEENDFTAIYQGLHILGEVRWFKKDKPMNGGKMREFLGKLDPRPQTIGLFVSHSGLAKGAWSVVRRAVNSKTVIVFERDDIESVLIDHEDIGAIFGRKLRDAHDFIFEEGQVIGG
jgi:hypothetical protein